MDTVTGPLRLTEIIGSKNVIFEHVNIEDLESDFCKDYFLNISF